MTLPSLADRLDSIEAWLEKMHVYKPSDDFEDALSIARMLPKVELHCHLDGSLPTSWLSRRMQRLECDVRDELFRIRRGHPPPARFFVEGHVDNEDIKDTHSSKRNAPRPGWCVSSVFAQCCQLHPYL